MLGEASFFLHFIPRVSADTHTGGIDYITNKVTRDLPKCCRDNYTYELGMIFQREVSRFSINEESSLAGVFSRKC